MRNLNLIVIGLFVWTAAAGAVSADKIQAEKDCSLVPGGWEKAIANCTAVLDAAGQKTAEERAYAYAGRGLAFLHKGDNKHAILDFDEAIKLDQKLSYPFYGRGLAEFRMKKFDEAISDFSELIRLGETRFTSLALVSRGAAYRLRGDLERAIADFNEELRFGVASVATHARLGEAYLAKDDVGRAIAEFSTAIGNSPSPDNAREYYVWRGKAYLRGNEIDKAVADFGYAIAIAPSAEAYLGRSEAYRRMGNERAANIDTDLSRHVTHEPFKTIIP